MTDFLRDRRFTLACCLLALATPSAAATQERHGSDLPSIVSLPQELDGVLRAYEAAWAASDADRLAELFTEDGFVLRPGHPPVRGRAAIREAYRNSGGPLTLRPYSFEATSDIGYIIGGYTSDPTRPDAGKFVLALRRTAARGWLIAADIDNGN